MKPEIKEKYVSALRSGAYKKTEGRLYSKDLDGNDCFCALGVLCLVAMQENVGGLTFDPHDNDLLFFKGPELDREDGHRTDLLPTIVMKWADLDSSAPFNIYRKNDGGYDFVEIANWVEEEL
jgi:hypothetical protein